MKALGYSAIIARNRAMAGTLGSKEYSITILSNVVVHQCVDILEHSLRECGVNAVVSLGNYDNIIQDAQQVAGAEAVVIFWEASNILEGLHYKIPSMKKQQIESLLERLGGELQLVFDALRDLPLVIVNLFSARPFTTGVTSADDPYAVFCAHLNDLVSKRAAPNVMLIDLDVIYAEISVGKSIDWRYYYSSKAPYTVGFFKTYATHVKPLFLSANGRAKKALIFDCDDTLWKGILGEDGPDGLRMSARDHDGAAYEEVQHLTVQLSRRGVLVGLCSKNNPQDVDEVLQHHPDMVLRDEHLAIKAINWEDKASNIQSIATSLNIGLDSIVFVDDSEFEINLIGEQLPEVTVLQVPRRRCDYPGMMREARSLFYSPSLTTEDAGKTQMYKAQVSRVEEKEKFADLDSYLASLGLEIDFHFNETALVRRMSQLTQKTNQFNLTTRRYMEREMASFVQDSAYDVIACGVKDKFGHSGIVGLAIIELDNGEARLDTFLMSCRVIGRNIEHPVFDCLMSRLADKGVSRVKAEYLQTGKNQQVLDFYEDHGFQVLEETEHRKVYGIALPTYKPKNVAYIKVTVHERAD